MDRFLLMETGRHQKTEVEAENPRGAGLEFAGGEMCPAGRNGITTGRRKTFLPEEKSSAGQDEMTVTREQAMARQATALFTRSWGNPCASVGRPVRLLPHLP